MERFRLRARYEPKRGLLWELHLFPDHPQHQLREADGRLLGSAATPEAILWLRHVAATALQRAEEPEAIDSEDFGPTVAPRWLRLEDGMRLALAFSASRWLAMPRQRRMFREGLDELPSEVVLYWFTLCFYGYRQPAGRAALRTLFLHDEETDNEIGALKGGRPRDSRKGKVQAGPTLFPEIEPATTEPLPLEAREAVPV